MNDRVGQQLGNYRLLRLLGRGGFAEVYLGEHLRLHTQVAVKLLHAQLAPADVGQFQREAETIAKLVHPHIVRVFDFDVLNGLPFLVMDYAPDGPLRQRHPKGSQVPLATVLSYVRQIADALQYAHDQRLIHRDLKPENVLLGRNQELWLSDFGISIVAESTSRQQGQGFAGTVAYSAPEQLQEHPRPASDQYALGVMVYEWLSGTLPFTGSFTEVAAKHLFSPPPPLHTQLPDLPSAVEQVVLTALEKDSKERFGSVRAFANALERASKTAAPFFNSAMPPPDAPTTGTSQASRNTLPPTQYPSGASNRRAPPAQAFRSGPLPPAARLTPRTSVPFGPSVTRTQPDPPAYRDERQQGFSRRAMALIGLVVMLVAVSGGLLWLGLSPKSGPASSGTNHALAATNTSTSTSTKSPCATIPSGTPQATPSGNQAAQIIVDVTTAKNYSKNYDPIGPTVSFDTGQTVNVLWQVRAPTSGVISVQWYQDCNVIGGLDSKSTQETIPDNRAYNGVFGLCYPYSGLGKAELYWNGLLGQTIQFVVSGAATSCS